MGSCFLDSPGNRPKDKIDEGFQCRGDFRGDERHESLGPMDHLASSLRPRELHVV